MGDFQLVTDIMERASTEKEPGLKTIRMIDEFCREDGVCLETLEAIAETVVPVTHNKYSVAEQTDVEKQEAFLSKWKDAFCHQFPTQEFCPSVTTPTTTTTTTTTPIPNVNITELLEDVSTQKPLKPLILVSTTEEPANDGSETLVLMLLIGAALLLLVCIGVVALVVKKKMKNKGNENKNALIEGTADAEEEKATEMSSA